MHKPFLRISQSKEIWSRIELTSTKMWRNLIRHVLISLRTCFLYLEWVLFHNYITFIKKTLLIFFFAWKDTQKWPKSRTLMKCQCYSCCTSYFFIILKYIFALRVFVFLRRQWDKPQGGTTIYLKSKENQK